MGSHPTKPSGLSPEYAAQFQDRAIIRAYRFREPYPPETFQLLRTLARVANPRVLELGCGTGDLTIGMSAFAKQIDAVDFSGEAIAEARTRMTGNNVGWIQSAAESAALEGTYDLVAAAQSLHWMDWPVVFARLRSVLRRGHYLAIVNRTYVNTAWWTKSFQAIIDRHTTNRDFKPYDLVAELQQRGYLTVVGDEKTRPIDFRQPIDDLIEAFHSRNGFSRDRMSPEGAEAFDNEARLHLMGYAQDGMLDLGAVGRVTWGVPR
jgi:SAM-dependent methyltransferase